MTGSRFQRAREIFEGALDRPSTERAGYVEEACAGDAALRDVVDGMLRADTEDGAFLEPPVGPGGEPVEVGARIGGYELVQRIASGGSGVVYLARGELPRREVALKALRPDVGDSRLLLRFQDECDILASLRHPHIAQLYEAGVHRIGDHVGIALPWFALELVEDARNLLEYAGTHQLDRDARLRLFLDLCDAVEHGHRRGVMHRDLKPGNILVDGAGRLKVIDFGIARVIDTRHREAGTGSHTRTGELLGTLSYMSPEQFAGDPGSIDTRTDVYSLGVTLVELMCGRLPYDFGDGSVVAVARAVREDPPISPSEIDPSVPRELDWIAVKALHKSPDARYAGVAALADDVRRFLRHETVRAGSPGSLYRARKFVRRHRLAITAAAVSLLLLIGGLIGTSIGWIEAEAQREDAELESRRRAAVSDFLSDVLERANPSLHGRDVLMSDVLDDARASFEPLVQAQPEVALPLLNVIGGAYAAIGRYDDAYHLLRQAEDISGEQLRRGAFDPHEYVDTRLAIGSVLLERGRVDEAIAPLDDALEVATRRFGRDDARTLWVEVWRLRCDRERGELARTEARLRELLSRSVSEDLRGFLHVDLVNTLVAASRYREAESEIAAAMEGMDGRSARERYRLLVCANALGSALCDGGDPSAAEPVFRDALREARAHLGDDHPLTATLLQNLGIAIGPSAPDEAEACYREALRIARAHDGTDGAVALGIEALLASIESARGRPDEAAAGYAELAPRFERTFGRHSVAHLRIIAKWARALALAGQGELAVVKVREVLDATEEVSRRASVVLEVCAAAAAMEHDAVATLRRVIDWLAPALPPSSRDRMRLEHRLSDRLAAAGDVEGASTILEEARHRTSASDDEWVRRRRVHMGIDVALLWDELGRGDDAIDLLARIETEAEEIGDDDRRLAMATRANRAMMLAHRERFEEAAALLVGFVELLPAVPSSGVASAVDLVYFAGYAMVEVGRTAELRDLLDAVDAWAADVGIDEASAARLAALREHLDASM